MQSILYIVGVIFVITLGWWLVSSTTPAGEESTTPPVATSTPPDTPVSNGEGDGETSGEVAQPAAIEDLIVVNQPLPGTSISSPVTISGQARGPWFFEATFPIIIVDWDGRIIGEGFAEAEGDWMTTDFVPFRGEVTFDVDPESYSASGSIIIQKANPSGLPQNDNALEFPVMLQAAD